MLVRRTSYYEQVTCNFILEYSCYPVYTQSLHVLKKTGYCQMGIRFSWCSHINIKDRSLNHLQIIQT